MLVTMKNGSKHYQRGLKLYFDGERVEAVKQLEKGNEAGDSYATAMLALSLFYGKGALPDKKRAKQLFKQCLKDIQNWAVAGDNDAIRLQGEIYLCNVTEYSIQDGYASLHLAADRGDKYASFRLGELYSFEDEAMLDEENGYNYSYQAHEAGVESAAVILTKFWARALENEYHEEYFEYCQKGNANCLCYVGECYLTGDFVMQNEKLAFKYFKKSADMGNTKAQIQLARMMRDGIATKKDVYGAVTLLQQAGQYDVDALCELGYWYENGLGVACLIDEALKYYKQASDLGDYESKRKYEAVYGKTPKGKLEQELEDLMENAKLGDVNAQYNLAMKYLEGKGVRKNLKKAIEWFTPAAKQKHLDSLFKLCDIYYRDAYGILDYQRAFKLCNILLEYDLTKENRMRTYGRLGYMYLYGKGVEHDFDKAIECYKESIKLGSVDSYYDLGRAFELKRYRHQNVPRAINLYEKGAALENVACLNRLAYIYFEGTIVPCDYKQGVIYAVKSHNLGSSSCHSLLAKAYWEGKGVEEDWSMARRYAESGLKDFADDWWALCVLGDLYMTGSGVEQNQAKGFAYHYHAAETGCVAAQYVIAQDYANGWGVEMDITLAKEWCQKAADEGHTKAIELLKKLKNMK